MGSKNACALEFACILRRNIKFSVIIINIFLLFVVSLRLVEEADLLRIQSATTNSILQELRCQLQQQKDGQYATTDYK